MNSLKKALCVGMLLAATAAHSAQSENAQPTSRWEGLKAYMSQLKNPMPGIKRDLNERAQWAARKIEPYAPAIAAAAVVVGSALFLRSYYLPGQLTSAQLIEVARRSKLELEAKPARRAARRAARRISRVCVLKPNLLNQ